MLTYLVLPLFGLLSFHYTFSTLIQYIHNPFLLLLCTILIILLQVIFVDQILPYNSYFNTNHFILQYIYPLWQFYYANKNLQHKMISSPFGLSTETRQNRSFTQDVIPFFTQPHLSVHKPTSI